MENERERHTNTQKKRFEKLASIKKSTPGLDTERTVVNISKRSLTEDIIKTDFRVPFVKRYVDDLLLALPTDKIDILLNTFNSYDVSLQFTVEKEVDNSIPFLGMHIIRSEDNILRTTWYREPMSSDRYINYYSYNTERAKINLVLALKHRVTNLTNNLYRNQSLQDLKSILLENSYPPKLIKTLLFSTPTVSTQVVATHANTSNSSEQFQQINIQQNSSYFS
nr:unnamed protein product [Callosobruchus analis]